jgi:hypothetical protein
MDDRPGSLRPGRDDRHARRNSLGWAAWRTDGEQGKAGRRVPRARSSRLGQSTRGHRKVPAAGRGVHSICSGSRPKGSARQRKRSCAGQQLGGPVRANGLVADGSNVCVAREGLCGRLELGSETSSCGSRNTPGGSHQARQSSEGKRGKSCDRGVMSDCYSTTLARWEGVRLSSTGKTLHGMRRGASCRQSLPGRQRALRRARRASDTRPSFTSQSGQFNVLYSAACSEKERWTTSVRRMAQLAAAAAAHARAGKRTLKSAGLARCWLAGCWAAFARPADLAGRLTSGHSSSSSSPPPLLGNLRSMSVSDLPPMSDELKRKRCVPFGPSIVTRLALAPACRRPLARRGASPPMVLTALAPRPGRPRHSGTAPVPTLLRTSADGRLRPRICPASTTSTRPGGASVSASSRSPPSMPSRPPRRSRSPPTAALMPRPSLPSSPPGAGREVPTSRRRGCGRCSWMQARTRRASSSSG